MASKSPDKKLDEAKSLAEDGNYDEAIDAYLSLIEKDVENARAWYCLGVIYFNTNQFELSVEAFENSNNIVPEHKATVANLEAARTAFAESQAEIEEDITQSQDVVEKLFIESSPIDATSVRDNVGDEILSARGLSDSGNHSAAVEMWKGILETDSDSAEIWRGLAEALISAGYPEKAEKCLNKADHLDNQEVSDEAEIAEVTELEDDEFVLMAAEAAMEEFDSSFTENIGDVNEAIRWYNMGLNLTNEGNTEEALSCFDKAIGAAPKEEVEIKVKAQSGRGNAFYVASRFSDSIIAYHTAIQLSPDSATGRVLYNMGSSYASLEMYDDAIKCFTQSLERGLDKGEHEFCRKQISRCRLLSREQAKRRARAIR